jgi:glycosyltransferase involved in cell wall biosynthesis
MNSGPAIKRGSGSKGTKGKKSRKEVKIVFLCGSLEQGKDGVGDYTGILAAECARLGHQTFLLSLNDSWIQGSRTEETILRLGSQLSWPERIKTARAFLSRVQPDLASLQFVPYSFHPAGLNFALPQILSAILGRLPLQIMFHEIWTGGHLGAPPKVQFFGFCQRKAIEAMVRKLSCQVAHTSNLVYRRLLAKHGITAEHLPLFGSVPIASSGSPDRQTNNLLRIGMFGSIHPEWSPDELFLQLQKLEKLIEISHIGRIGPGEAIWSEMAKKFQSQIRFRRLGETSHERISRYLLSLDLGLATTPLSLIGKSSTVAAMLEHGLPVIVTRSDIHFPGIADQDPVEDNQVILLDAEFLSRLEKTGRQPPQSRLPATAAKFLRDVGRLIELERNPNA